MSNFFAMRREQLSKERGRPVTQREIADALGITDATVGRWETNAAAPRVSMGLALSKVYQVPFETMVQEIAKLSSKILQSRQREAAASAAD